MVNYNPGQEITSKISDATADCDEASLNGLGE